MKHSHSCQSMPSARLKAINEQQNESHEKKLVTKSGNNHQIHNNSTSQAVSIHVRHKGEENGNSVSSSSSSEENPLFLHRRSEEIGLNDRAIAPEASGHNDDNEIATITEADRSRQHRESQAELSRRLEEVRLKSRSTVRDGLILTQRPRARSQEAAKFPAELRPRSRLRSEGSTIDE